MLKFRNILVGMGLLWCALAGAHPVVTPQPNQEQVVVSRAMEVLVDAEGHWDFSQVSDRFSGRFVPNTATEPNFGFTSSTIWLRFTLDTSRVQGQSWYLVERYYVRVSGKGAINLSPMLYSAAGLVEYTYRDILLYGVFYGCLLIMVVYNALLALSLKEPVYLYFVLFLVGITVFNLNVNGFGLQFVWPEVPKLNEYYWLGIYICTPALAMYSRHFLGLKQRFPRYDRVLRHYLAGIAVLLVVQLLIVPPWSYYLSTLLVLITVLLFSWLGWMVWSRGYRAARLYVAAWCVFLVLILVFALGNLDWLPYASVISMLPHLGALWVVMMLSLALGDRIRFLERERNQLFLEARENLERHVEEIEQMNRDKSTFLQYVSHELNTPINWIGAANSLDDGQAGADQRDVWALVRKGQQRLMGMVSTSLRYFDLADRSTPPLVARCRPLWMLDALLATRARALGSMALKVVNRISPNLYVRANETELQEVLAMALDNAIRFSPQGGEITVTSEVMAGEAELRIRDRGRGAGPDQLESLFEPFFVMGSRHHEEGYGLSLAMARVMIEQAGGRIWAESAGAGRGFTLIIRLPLA